MNLFDTNVLLDIATSDPVWLGWSENQVRIAATQGPIPINPIIYAELAGAFVSEADLDKWLDAEVFQRLPLPYSCRLRCGLSWPFLGCWEFPASLLT
jgi:hypothetical protein